MERIWILPVLVILIVGSLGFSQDAFADTNITDEPSCENAPVLGTFDSGTCVLDGTHTIPLGDLWSFQIPSKVTGTVDIFGFYQARVSFSNSGTINAIGGFSGANGVLEFQIGTDYANECNGIINLIGGTGNFSGILLVIAGNGFSPIFNNFGTITGTNSNLPIGQGAVGVSSNNPLVATFNNHGTLTAPVETSGTGTFNDNLPDQCDIPIGGTFVPIDQSALLLAGAQSISMWMIPVILAGVGIGIFVIKRRN